MKKLPGFKIDFEGTDKVFLLYQYLRSKISEEWNNSPLIFFFFLKFARKSVLLLIFCQIREILKPQFCWYFWNVLLSVILKEMKVSQVGYSNYGLFSNYCWICYSIFLFIVFFTALFSRVLWRKYHFSAQISKSISRYSILQKIGMSNFVILQWQPFEYTVKSWKNSSFLGLFFKK